MGSRPELHHAGIDHRLANHEHVAPVVDHVEVPAPIDHPFQHGLARNVGGRSAAHPRTAGREVSIRETRAAVRGAVMVQRPATIYASPFGRVVASRWASNRPASNRKHRCGSVKVVTTIHGTNSTIISWTELCPSADRRPTSLKARSTKSVHEERQWRSLCQCGVVWAEREVERH
jgi:hypothetical protein